MTNRSPSSRHWPRTAPLGCRRSRWRTTTSSSRTRKVSSATAPAREPFASSSKPGADRLRELGEDPFGDEPSSEINKKRLDQLLAAGNSEAAGVIHSAIESFAQELAAVTRRFLKLKEWKQVERLVTGGGMAGSRVGELAIGRASVILKAEKVKLDIITIRNEPDHAGLLGAAHLAPAWIFKGHDAALAADIGGTHIRAGLLALNLKRDPTLAKARVLKHKSWRHVDDKPGRDEAVDSLIRMLKRDGRAPRRRSVCTSLRSSASDVRA